MEITRRGTLRLALTCGLAPFVSQWGMAAPALDRGEVVTRRLSNGLRLHCCRNDSKYVSAALVLRSKEIMARSGGLAHILEHTSFTGAAGKLTARDLKRRRRLLIQDSNAATSPGRLEWYASFLHRYASDALHLLAITSLDQKFDLETVESEARVVLEELLLEKHSSDRTIRRRFNSVVFGRKHPRGMDTLDAEIATAKMPAQKLAERLREYAGLIRLPANMDLVLVGDIDAGRMCDLAELHFGGVPFASGPMLELPRARPTRSYHRINGRSGELTRPMSKIQIAWNTGVTIGDPEARVVLALGEYLNEVLFSELREKHGDTYSPEAYYEPDICSGVLTLIITTSKPPEEVEQRVFSILEPLKERIDPAELAIYRERWELQRLKIAESGDSTLEGLVARIVDGCAREDLDINSVSPEELAAAARTYLPRYKGDYVCVTLRGA